MRLTAGQLAERLAKYPPDAIVLVTEGILIDTSLTDGFPLPSPKYNTVFETELSRDEGAVWIYATPCE